MNKHVTIFTDGACRGNPGPGGWGALLRFGEHERELCGAEADTTNNRMELTGAIEGLNALKEPCEVTLVTDSSYVIKGFTEWLPGWKKRNWKNASKRPVLNVDLWQQLELAVSRHAQVNWQWVKGHSGHEGNERADALANQGIDQMLEQAG